MKILRVAGAAFTALLIAYLLVGNSGSKPATNHQGMDSMVDQKSIVIRQQVRTGD